MVKRSRKHNMRGGNFGVIVSGIHSYQRYELGDRQLVVLGEYHSRAKDLCPGISISAAEFINNFSGKPDILLELPNTNTYETARRSKSKNIRDIYLGMQSYPLKFIDRREDMLGPNNNYFLYHGHPIAWENFLQDKEKVVYELYIYPLHVYIANEFEYITNCYLITYMNVMLNDIQEFLDHYDDILLTGPTKNRLAKVRLNLKKIWAKLADYEILKIIFTTENNLVIAVIGDAHANHLRSIFEGQLVTESRNGGCVYIEQI